MPKISGSIRRRMLTASSAGVLAVTAVTSMVAAPGAALAANTAAPSGAASHTAAVRPDATYTPIRVYLDGRTITLWLNWDTLAYHAEISSAAHGDRIHLDYADTGSQIDNKTYKVDAADVPFNDTFANTGDHVIWAARACGFVGSDSKCTNWEYGAGT